MSSEANIILIGMRAVGKSTVGALLAERLRRPLKSIDALFEAEIGTTIKAWIEDGNPWSAFRAGETRLLRACLTGEPAVIDCGGGIVEAETNRDLIRKAGGAVWLDAALDTLAARIDESRPSVTGRPVREELAELRERRAPLYEECARIRIATDEVDEAGAVEAVVRELGLE